MALYINSSIIFNKDVYEALYTNSSIIFNPFLSNKGS